MFGSKDREQCRLWVDMTGVQPSTRAWTRSCSTPLLHRTVPATSNTFCPPLLLPRRQLRVPPPKIWLWSAVKDGRALFWSAGSHRWRPMGESQVTSRKTNRFNLSKLSSFFFYHCLDFTVWKNDTHTPPIRARHYLRVHAHISTHWHTHSCKHTHSVSLPRSHRGSCKGVRFNELCCSCRVLEDAFILLLPGRSSHTAGTKNSHKRIRSNNKLSL